MTTLVSAPRRATVAIVIRVLVVFDAAALLFAGTVHLVGARIPLGAAAFKEPPIIPAGIVEGLAGVIFVVALYASLAGKTRVWGSTLAAHLFAIAGFLVGIWATRRGTNPFNHDYHIVMLAVFVLGLILLMTPGTRTALDGGKGDAHGG